MDTGLGDGGSDESEAATCLWCGAEFKRRSHRGPVPKYCSDAHRQAAHRARHIPTIDTAAFEAIIPTIDTAAFEAIIPTIDTAAFEAIIPTIDTAAFEAAIPTIDTAAFEAIIPTIDTAAFEAIIPTIDTAAFEAAIPTIDTAAFEAAIPTIDTAAFEAIIPKIDTAVLGLARARAESSLAKLDGVHALSGEELEQRRDRLAYALILVVALIYVVSADTAQEIARTAAESLWAVWVLRWQLANSSPQGGLAVLLADYAVLRAAQTIARSRNQRDISG
jgi:hypothetical protein